MEKTFFCVEIVFNVREETKAFKFMNCTAKTVHDLRFQALQEGLQMPVSLDEWVVIFPWFITAFNVTRQEKFFNAASTLKQTVFDTDQKKRL